MKRLLLTVLISAICANLFSQVYKMENVYKNLGISFCHLKILEDTTHSCNNLFVIWGNQSYSDNRYYEVEYFKGDAKTTNTFITSILKMFLLQSDDDIILSYIFGTQVKIQNGLFRTGAYIFDNERKTYCAITSIQLNEIYHLFTAYCARNGITYK